MPCVIGVLRNDRSAGTPVFAEIPCIFPQNRETLSWRLVRLRLAPQPPSLPGPGVSARQLQKREISTLVLQVSAISTPNPTTFRSPTAALLG